jgi:hypothetical protein
MKKLLFNFYFMIILGLTAQAVFVVVAGNETTVKRLQYEAIAYENEALEERISLLQDKIARGQSLEEIETYLTANGYIAIDRAIEVTPESTQFDELTVASAQ